MIQNSLRLRALQLRRKFDLLYWWRHEEMKIPQQHFDKNILWVGKKNWIEKIIKWFFPSWNINSPLMYYIFLFYLIFIKIYIGWNFHTKYNYISLVKIIKCILLDKLIKRFVIIWSIDFVETAYIIRKPKMSPHIPLKSS